MKYVIVGLLWTILSCHPELGRRGGYGGGQGGKRHGRRREDGIERKWWFGHGTRERERRGIRFKEANQNTNNVATEMDLKDYYIYTFILFSCFWFYCIRTNKKIVLGKRKQRTAYLWLQGLMAVDLVDTLQTQNIQRTRHFEKLRLGLKSMQLLPDFYICFGSQSLHPCIWKCTTALLLNSSGKARWK